REHRDLLAENYVRDVSDEEKRVRKKEIFTGLQAAYVELKSTRWGGWAGYDRYFAQSLNNAHLAAIGAYNDLVPNFEALLHADGDDLPRFYERVKRLAKESREERGKALRAALEDAP